MALVWVFQKLRFRVCFCRSGALSSARGDRSRSEGKWVGARAPPHPHSLGPCVRAALARSLATAGSHHRRGSNGGLGMIPCHKKKARSLVGGMFRRPKDDDDAFKGNLCPLLAPPGPRTEPPGTLFGWPIRLFTSVRKFEHSIATQSSRPQQSRAQQCDFRGWNAILDSRCSDFQFSDRPCLLLSHTY